MKRWLAGVVLMATVCAPLCAQPEDVETKAMRDEMQRAMKQLHLEGSDGPYYIAYKISDTETKAARASFGALVSSGDSRIRTLSVTVRVGSYQSDSSNAPGGGGLAALLGSLGAGAQILPLDDSYDEIRRKIWLATDAAYKKAVEDFSAKKAAQANRNRDETIPDLSKEQARQESESLPPIDEKLSDAERVVRAASAVFKTLPMVETSEAQIDVVNTTEHFVNSEGTVYTRQVPEVYFHASATLQNGTGETFSDSYSAYGRSLKDLPAEAVLVQETANVADRLTARRKGKVAKRYNGPVLFEGDGAAEFFARHFAESLSVRRGGSGNGGANALLALLTGAAGGTGDSGNAASLLNKVGSRVLPDFLSVEDNPQLTQLDGHTLLGNYKFDEEGVPAQETVLVKDGILKTLLTSRTPARGMPVSTGNMRERGVEPGNLLVDASKSSSREELRAQLVELVKTRGLDYGYVLRRLAGNQALEAIRVYPDGHEETVRDARVAEVTVASFKDILAVSKERTVYTERPGALGGDLVTYVVPDLLFEDMTVEHIPNDSPKVPDIPSPLASN